ncbi:MAG: hypothetical protein OXI26_02015 [bacterium]|nr:hypothetical protein [bacterium]
MSRLNAVLVGAIDTPARFEATSYRDDDLAFVRIVERYSDLTGGLALLRAADAPSAPALFLNAHYTVGMSTTGGHLRVATSLVGLWADVTGGRKRPRPLVRVEYNRSWLGRDRAAAHVHLHANSPELAWMYGSSGRPAPDLHALHFPVGGRRFRPTLEEFLLFLDRENLFDNWKAGWKPKLLDSLEAWERQQARGTARQFPEEAVGALETLGYRVTAPGAGGSTG